jgi:hypothetical protein
MAFVPFEDTIKLEGVFSWGGQICENVHYFKVDATPDVALCEELAAEYIQWWNQWMMSVVSTGAALTKVKCTIMEAENSPGIEYSTGLPSVGADASPSMPNNVTIAVRWVTALRGRSYRGRTYHIGLTENSVVHNGLLPAALTQLLNGYTELIGLTTSVGPAALCVASRVSNGVERTAGLMTPVDSVVIDGTIDSQRRRLPGRGA